MAGKCTGIIAAGPEIESNSPNLAKQRFN